MVILVMLWTALINLNTPAAHSLNLSDSDTVCASVAQNRQRPRRRGMSIIGTGSPLTHHIVVNKNEKSFTFSTGSSISEDTYLNIYRAIEVVTI